MSEFDTHFRPDKEYKKVGDDCFNCPNLPTCSLASEPGRLQRNAVVDLAQRQQESGEKSEPEHFLSSVWLAFYYRLNAAMSFPSFRTEESFIRRKLRRRPELVTPVKCNARSVAAGLTPCHVRGEVVTKL